MSQGITNPCQIVYGNCNNEKTVASNSEGEKSFNGFALIFKTIKSFRFSIKKEEKKKNNEKTENRQRYYTEGGHVPISCTVQCILYFGYIQNTQKQNFYLKTKTKLILIEFN